MKAQYITIQADGSKSYYSDKKMTKLHREDGPAIERPYGYRAWFINNLRHRVDGPAIEDDLMRNFGDVGSWFIQGSEVTEQEHYRYYNPTKEATIKINGKAFTIKQLADLIETATIKGKTL